MRALNSVEERRGRSVPNLSGQTHLVVAWWGEGQTGLETDAGGGVEEMAPPARARAPGRAAAQTRAHVPPDRHLRALAQLRRFCALAGPRDARRLFLPCPPRDRQVNTELQSIH